MRASGQANRPNERKDGRTDGIAGGNTRTHSHWAIEGRIESVRIKRSVRYVALAREGDRNERRARRSVSCTTTRQLADAGRDKRENQVFKRGKCVYTYVG
jgi:hypothetical protein